MKERRWLPRSCSRIQTTYTIHLFTSGGHTDPQPRVNQVRVMADLPPTVQLVEPASEATVAPGSKPPVVVRASDDYGLGEVRIERRCDASSTEKPAQPVQTVASWSKFAASGAVLSQNMELDPAHSRRARPYGSAPWRGTAVSLTCRN